MCNLCQGSVGGIQVVPDQMCNLCQGSVGGIQVVSDWWCNLSVMEVSKGGKLFLIRGRMQEKLTAPLITFIFSRAKTLKKPACTESFCRSQQLKSITLQTFKLTATSNKSKNAHKNIIHAKVLFAQQSTLSIVAAWSNNENAHIRRGQTRGKNSPLTEVTSLPEYWRQKGRRLCNTCRQYGMVPLDSSAMAVLLLTKDDWKDNGWYMTLSYITILKLPEQTAACSLYFITTL